MAEFCLECFNKHRKKKLKRRHVVLDYDLCEGCGEVKKCVVYVKRKRRRILCKLLYVFAVMLTILLFTACGATTNTQNTKPYSIKAEAYGFEKAAVTNLITKETEEKFFDDIINDKTEYSEWGWMFSFSVSIKEDTEFIHTSENRCVTINAGLAYELIENDTLKLHFPRWQGYAYGVYDVVIILSYQKLYGENR